MNIRFYRCYLLIEIVVVTIRADAGAMTITQRGVYRRIKHRAITFDQFSTGDSSEFPNLRNAKATVAATIRCNVLPGGSRRRGRTAEIIIHRGHPRVASARLRFPRNGNVRRTRKKSNRENEEEEEKEEREERERGGERAGSKHPFEHGAARGRQGARQEGNAK